MTLSETWFVEGSIDFELQKYRLLAFLQDVHRDFTASRLYPKLSDVVFHYNNLVAFRDNKRFLQEQFPKRLEGLNVEKLELIYEKMLADDLLMNELEDIVAYASGELKRAANEGATIYDFVERQLLLEPVGILPLYRDEGYLLLRYGNHRETRAYAYTITIFEKEQHRFKGLRMNYVDSWTGSIANSYESIKLALIRSNAQLPQPAVFFAETGLSLPIDETLLPVAKRSLVRYIMQSA
jgi:hypothetical protein